MISHKIQINLKVSTKIQIQLKHPVRWKLTERFPNYQISSYGQVWNHTTCKYVKSRLNRGGYANIGLYTDGVRSRCSIHRLVAEAFIPNPHNLPIINHKNHNRSDNRVENLEWVNASVSTALKRNAENTSSQYFGVYRHGSSANKWVAQVCNNKKRHYIGYYDTELEAGQAYNLFVIKNNLDNILNEF